MRSLRMKHVVAMVAMAAGIGCCVIGGASSASADTVYDCNQVCSQLHTWPSGAVSDLWPRFDSGYQQALANMQTQGMGYVQARAQCSDGDWYMTDIKSWNVNTASHIDCDELGGMDIIANGADYTHVS